MGHSWSICGIFTGLFKAPFWGIHSNTWEINRTSTGHLWYIKVFMVYFTIFCGTLLHIVILYGILVLFFSIDDLYGTLWYFLEL